MKQPQVKLIFHTSSFIPVHNHKIVAEMIKINIILVEVKDE